MQSQIQNWTTRETDARSTILLTFILFREQAKKKKCLKNLIDSDCTISFADRELLDLGFADYNPFCANNRDPGATGNDQCHGVKDISGPAGINAAVGIKPGVMQALLFGFLSIWFFFNL